MRLSPTPYGARHLAVAAFVAALAIAGPAFAGGGPAEVVVLVNERSEDSVAVAEHYVAARDIPPANVCRVDCTTELQTEMTDFVRDVVEPLRTFLRRRGLEEQCRFLVLTQGMPIRARAGGRHVSTAAALALLDTPVCGLPQQRLPQFANPDRDVPGPSHPLLATGRRYMVTALLSTTADEARALVDRSVASDGTAPGKARFVYQDAAGAAKRRNATYDAARRQVEALGHATEHVPHGPKEVTDRKRVMGYMSGGSYSKLTVDGVGTNEYLPGALCDMLQSFGAVPENFTLVKPKQFPVTHMVRAGVTGVHGAVAEPYDIAFPSADLFQPYVEGFTLAETFHRKVPLAYWMNLVLGDPLCAPYAKRPGLRLAALPSGAWSGQVDIRGKWTGAARIELFVDGQRIETAAGDTASFELDTGAYADGDHHVLIQAVGEGPAEPCGWTSVTARFDNGGATARRPDPVAAPHALRVEAPEEVAAGEEALVAVTPVDGDANPLPDWRGRIELRTARPPVRWARRDVDGEPFSWPLRFTKAETLAFIATAADGRVSAPFTIRIVPGEPKYATTPLDRFPLGQAMDMEVHVVDAHGNRTAWEGTLSLEAPGDAHATLPAPVTLSASDRGRAVLRDVVLTQTRRQQLVFKDGKGRQWSAAGEGARVEPAALRSWLVGRPARGAAAAALFERDPGKGAEAHGAVAAGSLFLRHRDGNDEIDLPAGGTRDGDAIAAVAFVDALAAAEVDVEVAARARVRVLLDGKEVFDGVPKSSDHRKRAKVASVELSEGRHRLTVVAERKGRFSFALGLAQGKTKFPSQLRVRADSGSEPSSLCVSGRVLRPGGRGVAGVSLTLVSPKGEKSTASTADGTWWIEGVASGASTLRVSPPGADPFERSLELGDEHLTGVSVTLPDASPPTVTFQGLAAKPRFGRRIRVAVSVEDEDVVRRVRLLAGDAPLAPDLTRAPWRFDADAAALPRGPLELVAVAFDATGNEGRSAPVTVTLVDDDDGPKLSLGGLSRNALLKRTTTITARASDPLGVAAVRFAIDGRPFGEPLTAAPYAIELSPDGLDSGHHELECTATDTDGNETATTLRFRVK